MTRPAKVITSTHTYVADVQIIDGLAHATNVRLLVGSHQDSAVRIVADRVWSPQEFREVRWISDEVAA